MAPDRGNVASQTSSVYDEDGLPEGRSFTARGVTVGVLVGLVICFSNMYFGLQTGWVSSMTMPASLMGFGIFRALQTHLGYPFSPAENVLVQTVAGSMGIMPLGCGFVGVIPAMNYLLTPAEQGPLAISTWKLVLWSLGLCYFGVVFAVPLRRQVIIREKLRFPSGYSTAILIGVLHGQTQAHAHRKEDNHSTTGGFASLVSTRQHTYSVLSTENSASSSQGRVEYDRSAFEGDKTRHWRQNMRLLALSFATSGSLTIATYFLPFIRNLPVFGLTAAETWLWTLNPSLAYVGQGVIMGTETTLHMLFGAVIGWAFLSPLAHYKGWAPGPVDDWEHGSKGWIVWVSLAIMLADALVSLLHVAIRSLWTLLPSDRVKWIRDLRNLGGPARPSASERANIAYQPIVATQEDPTSPSMVEGGTSPMNASIRQEADNEVQDHWEDREDAPASQQVGWAIICVGLVLSILLCVVTTKVVFGQHIPLSMTITAVLVALLLSILGVRALGETDLNPVSGISKLAQLFFAVLNPQTGNSSIVLNLIAGAVSEAGALQAGDLMQDLKTGHLLGAAPNAQFWGQVIGATLGAIASALIYTLYTSVYEVPGKLFQIPTSYVWVFTARLVTGKGIPPMAREWATWAGLAFAVTTLLRNLSVGRRWRRWIPGGVAVAVGMYNTPSFTLARAMGGTLCWVWRSKTRMPESSLIVMASGLILGEGFLSIANLILQSFSMPHW